MVCEVRHPSEAEDQTLKKVTVWLLTGDPSWQDARVDSNTTFEARKESLAKTIRVTQVLRVRRPGVDGSDWVLESARGKGCKATGQCVLFLCSLCDVRCACQLPLAACTVRNVLMPAARQILDFSR